MQTMAASPHSALALSPRSPLPSAEPPLPDTLASLSLTNGSALPAGPDGAALPKMVRGHSAYA